MFNKKRQDNTQNPFGSFGERINPYYQEQMPQNMMPNMAQGMPSNYILERFQYEIRENRRRINNLAKRIIRIENYLRIRDTEGLNDDPNNLL